MSADVPNQERDTRTPQQVAAGNETVNGAQEKEPALVKLYSAITGESDSQACSVFMFVSRDEEKAKASPADKTTPKED